MYHPLYPYDPNDDRQADEKFIAEVGSAPPDVTDNALVEKFTILFDQCMNNMPSRQLELCQTTMSKAYFAKRQGLKDHIFGQVLMLRDAEETGQQNPDFLAQCNNIFMSYDGSAEDSYKHAARNNRTLVNDIIDPRIRLRTTSLLLYDTETFQQINGKHDGPQPEWKNLEHIWATLFEKNKHIDYHDKVSSAYLLLCSHCAQPRTTHVIEGFLHTHFDDLNAMWKNDHAETPITKAAKNIRRDMWINLATQLADDHPRKHHWVCHATQIMATQLPHESAQIQRNLKDRIYFQARKNNGNNKLRHMPSAIDASIQFFDHHRTITDYRTSLRKGGDENEMMQRYKTDIIRYPKIMADIGFRAGMNILLEDYLSKRPERKSDTDKHYATILRTLSKTVETTLEPNLDARIAAYNDIQNRTHIGTLVNDWVGNRAAILRLHKTATTIGMERAGRDREACDYKTYPSRHSRMTEPYFDLN